jgi:hypothetical protein
MPLNQLEASISLMLQHQIVPIVLWNSSEYKNLPEFGIASLTDSETGEQRTLFLRKELKQNLIANFESRRKSIEDLFMRYDMPPFFVEDQFNADALTEYFHQFVAA